MIDPEKADELIGQPMLAAGEQQVGTISDVLRDDRNNWPTWAVVRLADSQRQVPVPLADAEPADAGVRVPYPTERIGAAPSMAAEGHLHADEQTEAYRHYGLTPPPAESPGEIDPHIGPHLERWIT